MAGSLRWPSYLIRGEDRVGISRGKNLRLDELPRSDNVEGRRGDGSGGFPMGRNGGTGFGIILLLSLPRSEARKSNGERFLLAPEEPTRQW